MLLHVNVFSQTAFTTKLIEIQWVTNRFLLFNVICMLKLENDIVTPLKPKFNVRYGDDMFKTKKTTIIQKI